MKFSNALIPTRRQAPADAEVVSHKLLVRAGMIRRVAAGIYEFLPLGLRSLKRVANIVREELDKAGCQEVFLPHLVPGELWQESGRWQKYGKELLRIADRHGREYCFGPTHEETICDMVRASVSSYKSFPFNLYQIQTKFRDELRPRFGLMRGREFLMKDGYSFHTDEADLDREYQHMYQTYLKIFARCGLTCRAVQAHTGVIGGSLSHEFMVLAQTGEDVIASCSACDYAANLELASFLVPSPKTKDPSRQMKDVATPGMKAIETVCRFLGTKPRDMIKTLVYKASDSYVIVCLSGDREVNETKLALAAGADEIRLAREDEIFNLTGVPTGFLGPVGLAKRVRERHEKMAFTILYDRSLLAIEDGVTGANKADAHTVHVDLTRDLGLDTKKKDTFVDVATAREGDVCPQCERGSLALMRGIEVGHIFKLGKKYSGPMKVNFLDQNGKEQSAMMGTYGLGVGRTLAACVEQSHDDNGIIWPRAIAPYEIHLIHLDHDEEIVGATERLYWLLTAEGLSVLWDDRDERAGVKFNDADLIGIPLQVIASRRSLQKGRVEYKIRRSGERGGIVLEAALEKIRSLLEDL